MLLYLVTYLTFQQYQSEREEWGFITYVLEKGVWSIQLQVWYLPFVNFSIDSIFNLIHADPSS